MDLDAYVAERRGEWTRLEALTRRRRLSPGEADELVLLYQRAATHLSVIRSRSADPVLLDGLSRVVLAARAAITGGRRFSWAPVLRFFVSGLPGELYRTRWWWSTVGAVCVLLGGALMAWFAGHPDAVALFVSDAAVQQYVDSGFVSYYSEYRAQNFAALVWTNNALLAAQCLAAGVLLVPVLYLVGSNVFELGLTGGFMIAADRGGVFFAMITPHGLLELTSVFVAAGVGLRTGWAWIAPGPHRTRGQALAERARSSMVVALGLVVMLAVSGLLEAYVTPSPLPAAVRIGIGTTVWLLFLAYALGVGAAAHHRGESADLDEHQGVAPVPTA